MKKKKRPQDFLQKPTYPGGAAALSEFISKNLQYPEQAAAHQIEGIVLAEIEVGQSGKVQKAHIIRGLGYGCDEEALRVVKLLRFNPVSNRNMNLRLIQKINVAFKKPQKAHPKAQVSFNFEFVPSQPKKETVKGQPQTKKPEVFTYVIGGNKE